MSWNNKEETELFIYDCLVSTKTTAVSVLLVQL